MKTMPPEINQKGSHGDYDTIVVEVRICRDRNNGHTWSGHDLQDQSDVEITQQWPGWGTQAINSALFLESLRRATYTLVLSYLSNTNPDFLFEYQNNESRRPELEKIIIDLTNQFLTESTKRFMPDVTKEILSMMSGQISQ